MVRREFLHALGCSLLTSAIGGNSKATQAATEDVMLHPLIPIRVEILFVENYGRKQTKAWQDYPSAWQRLILDAAKAFQKVWGSLEFKNEVEGLPPLLIEDGKSIAGDDLYQRLTVTPTKKMRIALSNNWVSRHEGHENAGTLGGRLKNGNCIYGQTRIQIGYMKSLERMPKRSDALASLCNTLSHECTHYCDSGESHDGGVEGERWKYISYGIGCLTQRMAFPETECPKDNDPRARSHQGQISKG